MIRFETCERGRALSFLQQLYPSCEVTDSLDSAKEVLDLVERDIVRIPDPMMHGMRVAILPSRNYSDVADGVVLSAFQKFHDGAIAKAVRS